MSVQFTVSPASPSTVSPPTNIGPRGRGARRVLGYLALAAGGAIAAALIAGDAPRASRLVVAAPFFVAALCLLQARAGVCVALAARRLDASDDGAARPVSDPAACDLLAGRARHIYRTAGVAAALLTLVTLAFP
jgi:hypothetical protein